MSFELDHILKRKSTKFFVLMACLVVTSLGIAGYGLQAFVRLSFETIPEVESTPPNDLMVVLAGGKGRIRHALELIAEGRSKRLLIIGAGQGISIENIIPVGEWPVGVAKDLVEIENESNSTYENSLKIRELVLAEQLKEVIIVTSFYHALRTKLILKRMLPRWTNISVVGVTTQNFQQEGFWTHGLSLRLAIEETLKLVWYWAVLPQIL